MPVKSSPKREKEKKAKDDKIEFIPSHFIGIPVQDPIISRNYEELVEKISKQKYPGIEPWMFM